MQISEAVDNVVVQTARVDFEDLYVVAFPGVARFVRKMNGSLADARDIFHDALVVYCEKRSADQTFSPVSEPAYILGIARHLWMRKFKADRHTVGLEAEEWHIEIPENDEASPDENRLLRFLNHAGKKCMALLHAFYFDGDSMKGITTRLGYQSAHSATVQKYKCLEKIRDAVKEKSMDYADFLK